MSGVRGRRQHSAAATAPLPEGRNRRGGGAGRGVGRDTDGSGGRAMGAAQGMKRGAHLSRSPEPAEDAAAAADGGERRPPWGGDLGGWKREGKQ